MATVRSLILERWARDVRNPCRRIRHDYEEPAIIGAGINKQVCRRCGHVTISLPPDRPDGDPFE